MKFLMVTVLLTNFAYALGAQKKKIDESETVRASDAQNEKIREARSVRSEKQEEVERVNDDFDPELDAIDDDMTKDEGLNDD